MPLSCVASTGVFWLSLSSRTDLCSRPFVISISLCLCCSGNVDACRCTWRGFARLCLDGCHVWTRSKVTVTKAAESRTMPSPSTPALSTQAALASHTCCRHWTHSSQPQLPLNRDCRQYINCYTDAYTTVYLPCPIFGVPFATGPNEY
jgi:hypothetical protein